MIDRRSAIIAATVLAACAAFYPKVTDMSSSRSHLREVRRLLGPVAEHLAPDDAVIAAWAPDPNYAPRQYRLMYDVDEAGFRLLARQVGLAVQATPEATEALWRLPAGVAMTGWTADAVPPGAGLQAQGAVGMTVTSMRWHKQQLFIVVLPA